MDLLSDIRLRWFDESSLFTDDPRELLELFLDSLGVSSDVGVDVMDVLLRAKKKSTAVTTGEIEAGIMGLRKTRGMENQKAGLTKRNVQIWLKNYRDMGFVEKVGRKYMLRGNRKPSQLFIENMRPQIEETVSFILKVAEKLEKQYGL